MSILYKKAVAAVEKYNMLFNGAKIITGVSGGADSTALLLFLCSLREIYHIEIYAVHIHHGIRGAEADGDSAFVEDLCAKLGVSCTVKRYDIKKMSGEMGFSEEETGRLVRYREFEAERKRVGADLIAVAHNMNDQAETVKGLMEKAGFSDVTVVKDFAGLDRVVHGYLA